MKKILAFFIILTCFCTVNAQNQANWWFFGNNAGLDFNTGIPVPNIQGQLSTTEGCATISDACGGLLFYTDGIRVWNRDHVIMPNGTGLLGDPSSTQSGIIIPQPDSPNIYYVFTVGDLFPITGLNYSVVDMTRDGGLGDVIPSQKNINLVPDSTEKVAAAVTANGDAAWIVTYAESVSGTAVFDAMYAFKLTSSGIDLSATRVSTFTNVQADDRRGYLRISPDGSKIAMMTQLFVSSQPGQRGRGAWLFDFDNATGQVSNPLRLNYPLNYHAYGAEFSPDSRKVYVDLNTMTNGDAGDRLFLQYDLDTSNFESNPVTIFETDPTDISDNVARGALQLGPDGKIYYTRKYTEWLSVINDPDQIGMASNFVFDGTQVAAGTQVNEGLPPFYNAFFNPSFSFTEGCENQPSQFFADDIATCPGSSVLWDFGDPSSTANTSTAVNPTHIYTTSGTYTVTLTINTISDSYTTTKNITIVSAPIANNVSAINLCDDDSNDGIEAIDFSSMLTTVLGTQSSIDFQVTIHESLLDAQNDFNALPINYTVDTRTYYARIDSNVSNGCYETTPIDITIHQQPILNPIDNLYLCDTNNDLVETFDLNLAGNQALGTQDPLLFDISYHSSQNDANNNINQLSDFYNSSMISETIWLRIENINNTGCDVVDSFNIELIIQPEIPILDDLELCDDESNDGFETFDLSQMDTQILGNQPNTYTISYHETMIDAENGTNPLLANYTADSRIIWARLTNSQQITCYDIAPIQLTVFPHYDVILPDDFIKCKDDIVTIAASNGFVSYLWDTGETTSSIEIIDAGTYTVTATDLNGCTDTESITVTNYEPTQVTDIDIRQFTIRDNRIALSVTGSGPWQYSIDDFYYQDSPVFTDLLPGYYTVYIRSINGCDFITVPATIIAAPNFFTPNQDGFHDYWQVIAIETEPDAEIYIFDRFGKLLKQLDPLGPGWDGTYNNNPMPSTDYWFRVELNDGQSFRGHFTLKR